MQHNETDDVPPAPDVIASTGALHDGTAHDGTAHDSTAHDSTAHDSAPPKPTNSWVKQALSLGLGGLFLWLSFRNTDFATLWDRVQHLNVTWLWVIVVVSLISHWLRALRWVIMLQPLAEHKISVWNSFCAVMIGYLVNIAIPRGGEVARVISISKSESIPWAGVVPTMFIDRLLDVAMLVLLIGITLIMLPSDIKEHITWLVPSGVAMCAATVVGLFLLPKSGLIIKAIVGQPVVKDRLPPRIVTMALHLGEQFDRGTKSLSDPVKFPAIGLLSIAIWFCYWLNFYCCVFAFDLQSKIDISRSLMMFTIGSVGVLVPTPGSVGTYHYAVSQAMTLIGGIDPATALAFATVVHALSFVVLTAIVGAICIAVQSITVKRNQGGN